MACGPQPVAQDTNQDGQALVSEWGARDLSPAQASPGEKTLAPDNLRNQKQPGNSLKAQPNPDSNPRPRVLHLPPPHNLTKPSFTPSIPPIVLSRLDLDLCEP